MQILILMMEIYFQNVSNSSINSISFFISATNYQKNLLAQAKRKDYFPLDRYWKELPYHFNYAYAITCWKAQGSEFPYILGYDCHWLKNKNKDEYIKYLYTLVTRAEKAVILVGD